MDRVKYLNKNPAYALTQNILMGVEKSINTFE